MNQGTRRPPVVVLGSGNFGTCLAQHLADNGFPVTLWTRSKSVADAINKDHRNPQYLSQITLSPQICATSEIEDIPLATALMLVLAVPTQSLREVLRRFRPHLRPEHLIVCAAKGIENKTLALPLQIVSDVLGKAFGERTVVLSGPSFASEVIARQPTAVTLGSRDRDACLKVQEAFHTPFFRAYTSDDPIGLEVAGALKNVIAIAAGACAGLGYQQNAQAALLTRGLAEITRIGVRMGANPLTFTGLGGVGDLFLTCTSTKSRNYTVGCALGKGDSLDKVLQKLGSVAEGVATTQAAYELTQQLQVDAPIVDQVYQVLYAGRPIADAVQALMTREAKPELTLDQP